MLLPTSAALLSYRCLVLCKEEVLRCYGRGDPWPFKVFGGAVPPPCGAGYIRGRRPPVNLGGAMAHLLRFS